VRPVSSQSSLAGAQPFDPKKIEKYTVVQVFFEFPEEPPDFKFFIALKHDSAGAHLFCRCVKATTNVGWYENRPETLLGCVIYEIGQSPFSKRTAVGAHEFHNIAHAHFEKYAAKKQFKIIGTMPLDFHGRFISAIVNSELLKPKDKKVLLDAIGANVPAFSN
jgi:hypothetical protein